MSVDKALPEVEPINVESAETGVLPEIANPVTLRCLSACVDSNQAAAIFLENPAAFTTNNSAATASSTKISDDGYEAYLTYLTFLPEGLGDCRKQLVENRYRSRAAKQGVDKHGETFERQERVPDKTMQGAEFLYPELMVSILQKGIKEAAFEIPEEIGVVKISDLAQIIFSFEIPEQIELAKERIDELELSDQDLKVICNFLFTLRGQTVRPLLKRYVGETDLAANTVISFHNKLDLYLMLKQT